MDSENDTNEVTNSSENLVKQHSIDNEKKQSETKATTDPAATTTTTTSATTNDEKKQEHNCETVSNDVPQMEEHFITTTMLQNPIDISETGDTNLGENTKKSMESQDLLVTNTNEKQKVIENVNIVSILQENNVEKTKLSSGDELIENLIITTTTTTNTTSTSPTKSNEVNVTITNTNKTAATSATSSPSMRYTDLIGKVEENIDDGTELKSETILFQQTSSQLSPKHQQELKELVRKEYDEKFEKQRQQYEQQLEQLKAALGQKDNMIALFQRENAILEKEKEAFRKEKDHANKERESTVIKFAMKEKSVIDAKKEKDVMEKQLIDARKEIKHYASKFQALNEEKSRVAYLMDEKCNEVRKYQRECEKIKTDYGHLESKLKYHMNKLNMETEAKLALEKKLEEERNAPNKLEEKANEKLKIEFEAQTILLKHELSSKTEHLEKLQKDCETQKELIKQLQEKLAHETEEKSQLSKAYNSLQDEHNQIQNSYSEEMLNSAKLRGQLEELQVLKTQNTLKDDKISSLAMQLNEALLKLQDNEQDLLQLHQKEKELLSFNKEMSESIVDLQNDICLAKSRAQGIEAENVLLKKEKSLYNTKIQELENQLVLEKSQKNDERILLAKHLSEKTKLYENTKLKLENVQGDFEATKNKHATIVKELQREIGKFKKSMENHNDNTQTKTFICSKCQQPQHLMATQSNGYHHHHHHHLHNKEEQLTEARRTNSRQSSISTIAQSNSSAGSRRGSESSESDTVIGREIEIKDDKGPSKKHLIERILRLQQASGRQAEKIDFLEQHTLSLVAELQKKSRVVQYYMLRDQAGALTSSKSDQNKSELAKYGNGVMSAIYGGIKGVENKSMSLDLSLEINKKLQAVLEDTLLKNITLKENLDVLGLEVDNLTRKLRQMEAKR